MRRKLPPAERRSAPVYVLLRPGERKVLERRARHERRSLSTVLRAALLAYLNPQTEVEE